MERSLAALNFNQLYYFHVVAQEGSLAAAAKKLGVTQSTLSEQIKSIEQSLGEKLFDRKGGRLKLNDAGRHATEHTGVMFREAERLIQHVTGNGKGVQHTLDVGLTSGVARAVAARVFLPLFQADDVYVRVRHGDYDYLLHALISHELDLLISENTPTDPETKGLKIAELHKPELHLVACGDLAEQLEGNVGDAISEMPCVIYSSHSRYRWDIDRWLREQAASPQFVAEVDDVTLQLAIARHGVAAAFLPSLVVREDLEEGRLRSLLSIRETDTGLYALYAEKTPSDIVKRAVDSLATHLGSHGERRAQ